MSYDLAFWKTTRVLSAKRTYLKIARGKSVRGLDALDPATVERATLSEFSDWTRDAVLADGNRQTLLSSDEDGAFEVYYAPQAVIFTCHGMEGDSMNRIIDAMVALGMPLYDPQVDERFALA